MVGASLRKLRKTRNITQQTLARKLGVTRQAICMWEAERRELKATMLKKIAKAFNVPVGQILHPERAKTGKEAGSMVKRKVAKKKVTFEVMAPDARKVLLTGDFNSWDTNGITLKKSKNGIWKTDLDLMPGTYEYKFIVDGEWMTDPSNTNAITNTYGSQNSVKVVTE